MSDQLVADLEQATKFLDFLYRDCEGVAWLAVAHDGNWNEVPYEWPEQRSALLEVAMESAPWADVYVSCLLFTEAPKRKLATPLHGKTWWVDVDHAFTPEQTQFLQSEPAFCIVESGTPDHAHVYLQTVELVSPGQIQNGNQWLVEQLDGDSGWSEKSMRRLPGTFNHKSDPPLPVLLATVGGPPVASGGLRELVGDWTPPEDARGQGGQTEIAPVPVDRVPQHLQKKLDFEPGPEDDTSELMSELVKCALECGYSDGEVLWLAQQSRVGPAYAAKDRSRSISADVARMLPKAGFRPNHAHPGQWCNKASCPNKPDWMTGDPMTTDEHRERKVQQKVDELLVLDEARHLVAELKADRLFAPPLFRPSLTDDLAAQPEQLPETIAGIHRTGANAVLASQYKAGKTTTLANLVRSLADGEPFLDEYEVIFDGRVAFFNYELDEGQMDEWLRNLQIKNTDRVTTVHLRGQRLPLIAERAQEWAVEFMVEHDIKAWILDPFVRAFAGCGNENDNGEVGAFLDALDLIKKLANLPDLWVSHHFGRKDHDLGQEHGRGATRLDDWPDVRWLLTRQHDDRFLKIEGRGVDMPETQLLWNPDGRLRLGTGDRQESKRQEAEFNVDFTVRLVVDAVRATPGMGSRGIEAALKGTGKSTVGAALKEAIETGQVIRKPRGRNAFQHFPADSEQGELL